MGWDRRVDMRSLYSPAFKYGLKIIPTHGSYVFIWPWHGRFSIRPILSQACTIDRSGSIWTILLLNQKFWKKRKSIALKRNQWTNCLTDQAISAWNMIQNGRLTFSSMWQVFKGPDDIPKNDRKQHNRRQSDGRNERGGWERCGT